jgi:uncharacterized protein
MIRAWTERFETMLESRLRGSTEAARQGQRIIIGPWSHRPPPFFETKTGDLDFGPQARLDLNEVVFRWYDHFLKGVNNGIERERPVRSS